MSKITDFLEQPDAYTCQSAAIAKVLGYKTAENVMAVRSDLLAMAGQRGTQAGDTGVMGDYLRERVKGYRFSSQASLIDIFNHVSKGQGYEAIIHGFPTVMGHVWGIESATQTEAGRIMFRCDDPWYEYDFPGRRFTNRSGRNVTYSDLAIWSHCVIAWNKTQADSAYASGFPRVHDAAWIKGIHAEKGAWVHFVTN